jgi:mRNA interferase MazF
VNGDEARGGELLLVDLNPIAGHEQGGRRPVLVVSHRRYAVIPGLFLGVPLTSTDRGLPHHVRIDAGANTGLQRTSYAMTEQVRALSRIRIVQRLGEVEGSGLERVSRYAHLFIV